MNQTQKKLEPGTLEWDIERARGFVVSIIMDEGRTGGLTRDQIRQIAQETLAVLAGITSQDQILPALQELGRKYPQLDAAQIKQLVHEENESRAEAAAQVAELLKEGKLEEAGELAYQYTSNTSK